MEKQIGPATTDSWVKIVSTCAGYFKNARIAVDVGSQFEREIEQMCILRLRLTRMSPEILGVSSEEHGTGSVVGMDILLEAVIGIRDIFENASRHAKQTPDSRVYDITDDLANEPQRLVIKMRNMANIRESQFSTITSQVGGIHWTIPTTQSHTTLIKDLSRLMTYKERSLFDVLPAARTTMEKRCMTDVSQIQSECPQSMESVRKLVMGCDLDPLLQQALVPQITSNNLYQGNLTESGGGMRNGNIGMASRDNRYIDNTSKGAYSLLVNGDSMNGM